MCACVNEVRLSTSVEVLNFTNDLTMPPGAGPAPPATLFVCLSLYLESGQTVFLPRVRFLKKVSTLSLFENIS